MTTALPEASRFQTPDEHMQISRRFIRHAREELARGERLQASEKIWGAAQHALSAVGKERGWNTGDYWPRANIAYHLAEEFNNPQIRRWHDAFGSYHRNFYQNNIGNTRVIAATIGDVEQFVNDLESIRERGPQPFTIVDQEQIKQLKVIAGDALGNSLEEGQTYTDGFVNQSNLTRYRNRWAVQESDGKDDNTPPDDAAG